MLLRANLFCVSILALSACAPSSAPDANVSDASADSSAITDSGASVTACATGWNPVASATIDGAAGGGMMASANGTTYLLSQGDGSGTGRTNAVIWSVNDWSAPSVSAASWVSDRGHYNLVELRDGSVGAIERGLRTLHRVSTGALLQSGIPESTSIEDVLYLRDETLVSNSATVRRFAAVSESATTAGASLGSFSATDVLLGGRALFAAPDQSRVYVIGPNGAQAEAVVVDQTFVPLRAPRAFGGIEGRSSLLGPRTAVATNEGLWVARQSSSMQFVITLVRPDGSLEDRFQEPLGSIRSIDSVDARGAELAIGTSAGVRIFDTVSNTMRQQIVHDPAGTRTFAAYEQDALVVAHELGAQRQLVFVRYRCN